MQKNLVRKLESELHQQREYYNEAESQMLRRSSRDSGFGSVSDSDEAIERQKALHAKERMSWSPQKFMADKQNWKINWSR